MSRAGDLVLDSQRDSKGVTTGADVLCMSCGYNLRGLLAGGQCPECGEPIGPSLRPDRLRLADPSWLAKIVHGLRLIYVAMLATPPPSAIAAHSALLRSEPYYG